MEQRLMATLAAIVVAMAFILLLVSLRPSPSRVADKVVDTVHNNSSSPLVNQSGQGESLSIGSGEGSATEAAGETPFAETIYKQANSLYGGYLIYPESNETAQEGWFRLAFTVPSEAKLDYLCYIFMGKTPSREIAGATFTDYSNKSNETCRIGVSGGPVAECGRLNITIRLGDMMGGYNQTEDNWKDFFTCSPSVKSDFCQRECDALLEGLMSEERTPFAS